MKAEDLDPIAERITAGTVNISSKQLEEFALASMPLVKFLNTLGNPYYEAEVDAFGARLVCGVANAPVNQYQKD